MKILIISHNPITTYQNMGKTFLSLFSSFEKKELCQLYIYPTKPDVDICNSYFRITDREILKSYFRFGKVYSGVQDVDEAQHTIYETEEDAIFLEKHKKNAVTILGRDVMWSLSRWYDSKLKKWLLEEKPTCIFLAPGESKFIYNIAMRIARELDIDIFTYICDEYYFVKKPKKFMERFQQSLLKRRMRKVLGSSKSILTICEELTNAYSKEFNRNAYTIHTGSNFPIAKEPRFNQSINGITYMGNMANKRYESIVDIGIVLDELNLENNTDYQLFIYSPPMHKEVLHKLSQAKSIKYCGYVTGKEFENVLNNASILLHVEAFEETAIERVKHSVSTKIADALGSGCLLFAYGPIEIASIQHLIRNDCAVVVTNREQLKKALGFTLCERNHKDIINRAIKTANLNHESKKNSMTLHALLNEASSCR